MVLLLKMVLFGLLSLLQLTMDNACNLIFQTWHIFFPSKLDGVCQNNHYTSRRSQSNGIDDRINRTKLNAKSTDWNSIVKPNQNLVEYYRIFFRFDWFHWKHRTRSNANSLTIEPIDNHLEFGQLHFIWFDSFDCRSRSIEIIWMNLCHKSFLVPLTS